VTQLEPIRVFDSQGEDYKRAFREEPLLTRSIGIMTDTDNTGEKVLAYYGDISFERAALP